MDVDEKEMFDNKAFDVTLGVIENRIRKGPLRKAVRDVLAIPPGSDLATHEALLQIATSKAGCLRLVTTNFDQAFEVAPYSGARSFDYAPYLPIPGGGWNSVVHLHGGLGNARDPGGESLVFTSADFGRAYITEGWASRFLAELFRRTSAVLFIGYSVSDPAVRYIVDAFAADRSNPDAHVANAYILAGAVTEYRERDARTWRGRGIAPIIYDTRDGADHILLHETIRNCAKKYRRGFFDRDSIVLEYGSRSPLGGLEPEAISQMTWALRDPSGHVARQFAALEPPAPLEWLDAFEDNGLFTLTPQSSSGAPLVAALPSYDLSTPLEPVVFALSTWLCKHLAEHRLLRWVIKKGAHLHPTWASLVRQQIADANRPQLPKGTEVVWRFLSASIAAVNSPFVRHEFLLDNNTAEKQVWNVFLRDLVLSWLAPTVRFSEPMRLLVTENPDFESVRSNADIELCPAVGQQCWDLARQLLARQDADEVMRELLSEITSMLHRGLTYLYFLEHADQDYDGTCFDRPSIDDHPQNHDFHPWTIYIHLLRTAWERTAAIDVAMAREEVGRWMRIPYPLFRRFVLWSAGKAGGLAASESVEHLCRQPSGALWGMDTRRELLQYLTRIGPQLTDPDAERLLMLLVSGPPRSHYRAEISEEEYLEYRDHAIYLRLMKLSEAGMTLTREAQEQLDRILGHYPNWPRATTESDGFATWMEEGHEIGGRDSAPRLGDYRAWDDEQVVADLVTNPNAAETIPRLRDLLLEDAPRAARIMGALGVARAFDPEKWALALEHLDRDQTRADCIRLFGAFGNQLGAEFLSKRLQGLIYLVESYCREQNGKQDENLWRLWDLLLDPAVEAVPDVTSDHVSKALSTSIGRLAEALLIKLGERKAATYEQIPQPIRSRLASLLEGAQRAHRIARVVLARSLAWLYRLKPDLVVPSFLARFDWGTSDEAQGLWSGYLVSGRITPELWMVFGPLFLATCPNSSRLGDLEDQFYSVFAFILLHEEFTLDSQEARTALRVGTPKGRAHVAWYWWRQVDSATDYGATLFRERLRYLLTDVWPLEVDLDDEASSANLARLTSCCGTEFESAVQTVAPRLAKIRRPHGLLFAFQKKDFADRYPAATLLLLNTIIGDHDEVWGRNTFASFLTASQAPTQSSEKM
jgi:hypothetical protein